MFGLIAAIIFLLVPAFAGAQPILDDDAESTSEPDASASSLVETKDVDLLTVQEAGVVKIPMAIPEFKNLGTAHGDLARKFADIITGDMQMSGEFEVIDRVRYIEDPQLAGVTSGTFAMDDWKLLGPKYLIKGAYKQEGENLTIACRLYNVELNSMLVGKEYKGAPDDAYKMIHLFSNEVFLAIFGHKSFFGTQIAFVSGSQSNREVYIMDVDGRRKRRMTNLGFFAMSPKWSPDAKKIVFAAVGDTIQPSIYMLDVASGRVNKVISVDDGVALTPEFTPDGRMLVASFSFSGNTETYELTFDGKIKRNLTNHWAIDMAPAYSPDGKQMLFISDRTGMPQVHKMDADGSNQRRISYFGTYNQSPTWAPRGEKIAYSSREYNHYTIYLIDEDGGEPYALTADMRDSCEYPSFSPDGRALAFACETKTGRAVYLRSTNDTYTTQLTKGTSYDSSPSWSPVPAW
ncbi:MAG: PD40 domain-containing protein [Deltaproteobacteria bacterium]|nr:PD40 domain-containing protein [Deltaproteobacteria bacterium]MCB9478368.1 PD40 domain-containing protein [Deltaproteobacteria bacterium]